jgi:Na+-translocating ferredoxin:NAD+ oxidoreductase RNF subunit RnfB
MIAGILVPVAAMAALGLIFGVGLAYALRIFGVSVDPKMLKLVSMLPGTNCGACGMAGCAGFAEALAAGSAAPSGCVVAEEAARRSIAAFLGFGPGEKVKTAAVVLCAGGSRAKDKFAYRGIRACGAASLVFGGQKACGFGCLGFGDCARSCPFGAIAMGPDALPAVDSRKCRACGRCVKACPKRLCALLPAPSRYYVKCSSTDAPAATAKACPAGCIACMKCVTACPAGAAKVESNLSRIDPAKCRNVARCFEVCPVKVIAKRG